MLSFLNLEQPKNIEEIQKDVLSFFKEYYFEINTELEQNNVYKENNVHEKSNYFNFGLGLFMIDIKENPFTKEKFIPIEHKLDLQCLIGVFMFLYGDKCDLNFLDVSKCEDLSYLFKQTFLVKNLKNGEEFSFSLTKFNGCFDKWVFNDYAALSGMFCDSEFNNHEVNLLNNKSVDKDELFMNSKINKNVYLSIDRQTLLTNIFKNSQLSHENLKHLFFYDSEVLKRIFNNNSERKLYLGMFKDSKINIFKLPYLMEFLNGFNINYSFNEFTSGRKIARFALSMFSLNELLFYQQNLLSKVRNNEGDVKTVFSHILGLLEREDEVVDVSVDIKQVINREESEVRAFLEKVVSDGLDEKSTIEKYKNILVHLGFDSDKKNEENYKKIKI